MRRERDMETRDDEATPSRPTGTPRECLGTLFFSSARVERGSPPLCAGLSRRGRRNGRPVVSSEMPPEGGDWRFVCVGLSEYEYEANLKRPKENVQLPKCAGLEIVSASAVARQRPRLLPVGQPVSGGPTDDSSLRRHQADRRKTVPMHRGPDWEGFAQRFARSSRGILDKATANAIYMRRYVEHAVEEVRRWGTDEDS